MESIRNSEIFGIKIALYPLSGEWNNAIMKTSEKKLWNQHYIIDPLSFTENNAKTNVARNTVYYLKERNKKRKKKTNDQDNV